MIGPSPTSPEFEAQFAARAPDPDRPRPVSGLEPVRGRHSEGWPAARLTVPNRRRDYALPPSAYPASFGADVDAYLAHLAGDDLFDCDRPRSGQPNDPERRSPSSLSDGGRACPFGASRRDDPVARRSGRARCGENRSHFFYSRNGKRKTGQIHNFALTAIKIAKQWVKARRSRSAALQAIRRQVDPKTRP